MYAGGIIWQRKTYTTTRVSPVSRARIGSGNGPVLFLAPTDWRAASTRCLRSCPTPLTRPAGATESSSPSPAFWTGRYRWRIWAAAAPWTGTRRRGATTGSWCSASCTPAASTTTRTVRITSSLWVSTALAPAPPSTPPAIWMSRCTARGRSIASTSSGARSWASWRARS